MSDLAAPVAWLGRAVNQWLAGTGSLFRFAGAAFGYGLAGLVRPRLYDRGELTRQIEAMGARSVPLICGVGLLIGAGVMAQTIPDLERRGIVEAAPGVLAITVTRFIAPVITALLFAGRVGASLAAEIGSMKINEELEAMQAMAVNPVAFVVAPRVMAVGFALAGLTLMFEICAIVGGFLMAAGSFGMPTHVFVDGVRAFIGMYDISFALVKAFCFAIGIAAVACHKGFRVEGGSAELGRATMAAVVWCQAVIVFIDLVCSMVNNVLQNLGWVPVAP